MSSSLFTFYADQVEQARQSALRFDALLADSDRLLLYIQMTRGASKPFTSILPVPTILPGAKLPTATISHKIKLGSLKKAEAAEVVEANCRTVRRRLAAVYGRKEDPKQPKTERSVILQDMIASHALLVRRLSLTSRLSFY